MKIPLIEQNRLRTALEARAKLTSAYHRSKLAQFEQAFKVEPRLKSFAGEIKRCGSEDAELMISLARSHYGAWLRNTSTEIRALALEIVSTRIRQIREHSGLPPFNDPVPGESDDVFIIVKKFLGVR